MARRLPLEGIRVLDLTVVWAGPYTTMLLGDLGAEVIRVENPWVFPSSTRGVTPRPTKEQVEELSVHLFGLFPNRDPGERPFNRQAIFTCHGRNKRSMTLDLRKGSGREVFLQLIERSDVLVENNAARVLDGLGIGWEVLKERNDRLIALRMPPVGLTGPYRDHLGFGVHFESLVGLTAIRGYADADLTTTTSAFHMDAASGAAGAFAIMLALRRLRRTGKGALIELAQSENMMQHIGEMYIEAAATGRNHAPNGNRSATRAPQGVYQCAGDDRWVAISVGSDDEWAGLRRAMGPDAAWATDDRFNTIAGRIAHHDEIDDRIAQWTASLDDDDVFRRCQAERVPAGPVLDEADAYGDPHLRARRFFSELDSPDTGIHEYPAHAFRWSGPPMAWDRPSPALGADNDYVYREVLGVDDARYRELDSEGHIARDYLGPDGTPL